MTEQQPQSTVWPAFHYDDAHAAIRLLVDVYGFREALVVPGEQGGVLHAELRWPEGGGVMLGSAKYCDAKYASVEPGKSGVCVVTDHVDAVHERVVAAGVEVIDEPFTTNYGSYSFTARDTEGNLWTFGTYRGAP
ncbi:VOC family protein [Amycolatopsis sp. CA-230715]|uniref:VOC family protein n=1 Tax=Amycolatopsis sp. CA-230715 TaxID=2745196 RepID=UPI001C02F6E9|nr:VOC family protein [Amycolatopsis sp. CA-230715]QWF83039.1 hypothetical protein HUW46_06478 [Amycolatopsis sp. CA-230715]